MNWIRVDVRTTHEGLEVVSARLYEMGVTQIEILNDIQDIRAHLKQTAGEWDYADERDLLADMGGPRVAAYLPDTDEGRAQAAAIWGDIKELAAIDVGLPLGSLEVGQTLVDEDDWANAWKKYFKPFAVGCRLLVEPEWDRAPDAEGREIVTLAFAMVFGTGQHESTRLCLEQAEGLNLLGASVLDLGCGTGILSLGALRLGASRALCVDIDPLAADVCARNAILNGVEKKMTALTGNALTDAALRDRILREKYAVVFANIVADVIIPLAPLAAEALAEGGTFICSGIVRDREAEVAQALLCAGMEVTCRRRDGEWVSLAARRAGAETV